MYDTKCGDLAAFFLEDEHPALRTPEKTAELAQVIQTAIEDWIAGEDTEAQGRLASMRSRLREIKLKHERKNL
jgi:hypothetical protein